MSSFTRTTVPELTLHRKLAQVMYEAERIPKRGKAPQAMGGYPFVQVGDAADYIRKALAEQKLTMMPTKVAVVGQVDRPTKAGGSMTTVDLIVDWTITDGESGESITIQSFGAGADGGDKYSGKASTSAMKYALLTGFLLSTGEDSELGTTDHALRSPILSGNNMPVAPAQALAAAAEASPFQTTERGIVEFRKSGPADGELRSGPNGAYLVFALILPDGHKLPQVAAYNGLAESLALLRRSAQFLDGMHVACTGVVTPVKLGEGPRTFQRMSLSRLESLDGDGWTLPAPEALDPDIAAAVDELWPEPVA